MKSNWVLMLQKQSKIFYVKGEDAIDHNNQMVEEILLDLQEPRWFSKVSLA